MITGPVAVFGGTGFRLVQLRARVPVATSGRAKRRPEMGCRDLLLGPHGEGGTEQRGIGVIGTIGIGPPIPTMVPMLSPLAKTTPSLVR